MYLLLKALLLSWKLLNNLILFRLKCRDRFTFIPNRIWQTLLSDYWPALYSAFVACPDSIKSPILGMDCFRWISTIFCAEMNLIQLISCLLFGHCAWSIFLARSAHVNYQFTLRWRRKTKDYIVLTWRISYLVYEQSCKHHNSIGHKVLQGNVFLYYNK